MIERSADGIKYTALLTVKPNTSGRPDYTAYDNTPVKGLNYYRLVQYDKDGRKTTHGVRVVNFAGEKSTYVQVYPNPAAAAFVIRTEPDVSGKGMITITDVSGRTVKTFVASPSGVQTITTDNLANGTYFVHIRTSTTSASSKLIIKK